jgi:hypothetical protein
VFKGVSERFASNMKQTIPLQAASMEQYYSAVFQCVHGVHGWLYMRTSSLAW